MSRISRKLTATKKLPFVAGLVVAAAVLTGGAGLAVRTVSAAGADCDSNAIIYCGVTSPSNFIGKVKAKNSGNGHADLQTVYAHQFAAGQSLTSGMYNDFASHAVAGTAYRDGRIVVNGQTVATATKSIGRQAANQGSGYFAVNVGGTAYYGNTNDKAFASDSLPVYVLFDSQGTMQFAVLKSCGNPIFGSVTKSSASCNSLTKTPVSGQLNTYSFAATANISGNARLAKCTYNFGDGTASKTVSGTGNRCPAVTHTYIKAGNFTASVSEYASVPGNSNLQLPVISLCTKPVAVTLPFYSCVMLTGAILDQSKFKYSFTAKASFGNGASFTSADFTFGDGNGQNSVKPGANNMVTVTHTYAKAGKYNIAAMLHFNINGKAVTAPTCTASVTPTTPPTPTCKPGVPVGSAECLPPCQPGSTVPPESAQCQPPELPNTGAGNIIAIFAGVVIISFLGYRQILFRKHKAAFVAAQQGTSPLPLGDPLSDNPLAGTPLATKHRSFRRKRPF